ncbi:MAG TPA: tetratricopeptide repeat protein [Kiritimatiellia bacterium]|nr:tetratricopeptide repeat protein [Kiritimatiellia bacterium]HRZ13542.1 tetratricopeptide repeat protein [Kiritimatiellia bacterium]HSA19153.1 tetratricopeptide repeat protein [Kiritimatiellia bacterium]
MAAGLLAYGNSFHRVLHLDDLKSIRDNEGIRKLWPPSEVLNPPTGTISFYTRPILNATFALDYAVSGTDWSGYRRTNLLLQVLSGCALYFLLARTLRLRPVGPEKGSGEGACPLPAGWRGFFSDGADRLAWIIALLWLVHPLNTAAVNYLSQRGEILVALCLWTLLYCVGRAADGAGWRARWWQAAATACCLLGMGSKEHMLAAPLLALLYDRLFLADSWRALWRQRGLMHATLWLTAWWPIHRQCMYSPHITEAALAEETRWRYLLTQCRGLVRMIRLALWPSPLVFYYGRDLATDLSAVWLQALLLGMLAAATAWALVRRPRAGFAGAFSFLVLAPSSTLVPIIGQPVAEHRMYAPLAALLALGVGALQVVLSRMVGPRRAAGTLLGLALIGAIGLGAVTRCRNADYRDPLILWRDTVRKVPLVPEAHYDYANALREAGRLDEAVAEYREAVQLSPDYVDALVNEGALLAMGHRAAEAIARLEQALQLKPDNPLARQNLASAYLEAGEFAKSAEQLDQVLKAVPFEPLVTVQWAQTMKEMGRGEEALGRLRDTLKVHPGHPALLHAEAEIRESLNRFRGPMSGGPGITPGVGLPPEKRPQEGHGY